MEAFDLNIINLLALLIAAWLAGAAARRIGYPSILGELVIGILLGPGLLGWLEYTETIRVLSEIGIMLLMVYIGIEIDFKDLKKASWPGLLASIGGFAVPFVLGYYATIWFGGDAMAGMFVGMAVGVTSLATKSRILVDLKLLNTRIAYVLMASALISDTLALLIFAGILSVAAMGTFDGSELLIVALKAIAFFAVTILIGLHLLPRLGKYLSKFKSASSTFFFTSIIIVALAYAELAELAGMHSILGAFMAGLFIKDNLFPKNISKELHKAFYDVSIGFLAPVFFVSAGFMVNLNVFQTNLSMLLTIIALAIIGKILGAALFYLPTGLGWREGVAVGAGMNGRGAVEIIIAGIGLEMGIINQDIFSILVFMAILTTMTVPFLLKWTTDWLKRRGELVVMNKREGLLILGANPLSLLIAQYLKDQTKITFIDANQDIVTQTQEQGFVCYHGNALQEDVLAETGADTIHTFIAATANTEVNILATQLASGSFQIPHTHVLLSKSNYMAGIDILELSNTTSLFASGIDVSYWFNKISSKDIIKKIDTITEPTPARTWIKQQIASKKETLPLIIEDASGEKLLFHFGYQLQPSDKVHYII
ncbi:cation:proton antiporter [Mangrovimonas sp. YM274]|uniref:cation:proton antiporter n=1 Tax=Mangrovimonas sp. YM274 TaxID=3070660 RepID=UPI0027DC98CF|nr:cation:proton antiporter [Mangrovimonas sp. YM274]WMI69034.1 cation:proton antiporter [Mangrovimonas sp. YM274]